jgi:rSAM/selenodomain-associated transferase 1
MVDVASADTVAVLTRAPSAGGKSRLFAALGTPPDPDLLAALLLDTIEGVMIPGVRVVVAVTPGDACDEVTRLVSALTAPPESIEVVEQPEGDLGARMRGTMARLFDAGARAVALVGSDLPSITDVPVRAAFDRLAQDRDLLVLGPAVDGGYYLVAATRVPPVFERITWGSADVLEQTCAAAAEAGMRVHFLDSLTDVDTLEDLRTVAASSRTAHWMRRNGIRSRGKRPDD